jgi:hypothetical protein
MQEPFPSLMHLRLESKTGEAIPALPDTFLAGSAPRLQTISLVGIPFPAAPTLLLSAHNLVAVVLSDIPSSSYIPPEVMVATLAALPRLNDFFFGFERGLSYPDRTYRTRTGGKTPTFKSPNFASSLTFQKNSSYPGLGAARFCTSSSTSSASTFFIEIIHRLVFPFRKMR